MEADDHRGSLSDCQGNTGQCPRFQPTYGGIEVCTDCGIGRTVATTVATSQQNYLDDSDCGGQERPDYFRMLFKQYCRHESPGRALDVGCGRGEWVRLLKARGWTAHGIDSFQGFLPDNETFFQAALNEYSPPASYDFITLVHCFEHIVHPSNALQRLAQLLTPAGRLLIIVPNFGGAWSRLCGRDWHMLRTEHHALHYTAIGLTRLLKNCGYQILRLSTCSQYAPSITQMKLNNSGFYERGFGSIWPVRPLIFRTNDLLRPLLNKILDAKFDGAEIHVLATFGNH